MVIIRTKVLAGDYNLQISFGGKKVYNLTLIRGKFK